MSAEVVTVGVPGADELREPVSSPAVLGAVRSPAVWLLALTGVSTLVRLGLGVSWPGPWIVPDELLYADLARSVADGGLPSVRGETALGWGVVYPMVIAPAWALFTDPLQAHHAALAINALVMSLAAIPAYLLARLFVPPRPSLLVATGSVLVPSMALTTTLMTENAAYPLFLLALWLVARSVRNPTTAAQLTALVAVAVLALTRVQGAALLPALLAAGALYARGQPPGARSSHLRRFAPTALLAGLGLAVVAVAGGPGWLGGRSETFGTFEAAVLPRLISAQLGDIVLLAAVVPVLASVLTIGIGLQRGALEAHRLFASVALPTLLAVLVPVALVAASVEIPGVEGVNERYVVHVLPLLLVGLAVWLHTGRTQPRWAAAVIVVAAAAAASLPFERLEVDAGFYAPSLAPWVALPLPGAVISLVASALVVALCTLGLRGSTLMIWTAVLVALALAGLVAVTAHATYAGGAAGTFRDRSPSWVDNAVSSGTAVPVLWDERRARRGRPDPIYRRLVLTEMFNDSVGVVLRLGGPTHFENVLPTRPVRLGLGGAVVDRGGRGLAPSRYLLADCRLGVEGRREAVSPDGWFELVRLTGPIRIGAERRCTDAQPR